MHFSHYFSRAALQRMKPLLRDSIAIFAIALLVRLGFGLLIRDTYDYDEFVILLLARDFAHGAAAYHDFMFFHPPGVLVVFRLLEPLTALWWPLGRVAMMMTDSLTAALVFVLARRLYDRPGSVAAGLLYAFNPLALVSGVRVGQDPIITMLVAAALVLTVAQKERGPVFLAGLCLGLAVWIKYPAVIAAIPVAIASGRRVLWLLGGFTASCLLAFSAFLPVTHQLYQQTVTFQQHRWTMVWDQRIQTVLIFWIGANVLGVAASVKYRQPPWLLAGFAVWGVFALAPQAYYHYFTPATLFGSLLAAPLLVRLGRPAPLLALAVCLTVGWAALLRLGGNSPLYVTAARLSAVERTQRLIARTTPRNGGVLADRYEYAYLANRPAVTHYFWNVGVLVDARYLEKQLSGTAIVVMSTGASSGFPTGFAGYLNARYPRVHTTDNTVWLTHRN